MFFLYLLIHLWCKTWNTPWPQLHHWRCVQVAPWHSHLGDPARGDQAWTCQCPGSALCHASHIPNQSQREAFSAASIIFFKALCLSSIQIPGSPRTQESWDSWVLSHQVSILSNASIISPLLTCVRLLLQIATPSYSLTSLSATQLIVPSAHLTTMRNSFHLLCSSTLELISIWHQEYRLTSFTQNTSV